MSRTAARTLTLIIILGVCSPAWAQTGPSTFGNLGRYLKAGDSVLVVERAGGEPRDGRAYVGEVSGGPGDGSRRELTPYAVGWIERIGDPTWDGALLGAAVGYGYTLVYANAFGASFTDRDAPAYAVAAAAILAPIYWLADAVKVDHRLVYGTRLAANWQFRTPPPVASLDELWSRVRPGDTVYVRDKGGRDLKGRFARASRSSLTLIVNGQSHDIAATEVQTVSRRTARLWRDLMLGVAAAQQRERRFGTRQLTRTMLVRDSCSAGLSELSSRGSCRTARQSTEQRRRPRSASRRCWLQADAV